jgi:hypothetical protein
VRLQRTSHFMGNTNCNGRGEALVEFLRSSNLEILYQGSVPTFCCGGRIEAIVICASRKHYKLGHFNRALPVGPQTYSAHFRRLRIGTHDQEP